MTFEWPTSTKGFETVCILNDPLPNKDFFLPAVIFQIKRSNHPEVSCTKGVIENIFCTTINLRDSSYAYR